MRLGEHMMLIQLQLSTVTPSSSRRSANTSSNANPSTTSTNGSSSLQTHPAILPATTSTPPNNPTFCNSPTLEPSSHSRCSNIKDSTLPRRHNPNPATQTCSKSNNTSQISVSAASTSPLLVSSRNSLSSVSPCGKNASHSTPADGHRQKISHKIAAIDSSSSTSLQARPFASTKSSTSNSGEPEVTQSSSTSQSSHNTVQHLVQSPLKSLENATNNLNSVFAGSNTSNTKIPVSQTTPDNAVTTSSTSQTVTSSNSTCKCEPTGSAKPTLDTRALAEASRNLTQTLKQLSSEVLTPRPDQSEDSARARRQGAIIESMHHHGKGVYSGTFSGTLNPALQDRFGRPKRDISTIIHILNDLLCATPQYRRHARQGHTITLEASSGSPAKSGGSGGGNLASADGRSGHSIDFMEESLTLSQENQATRGKMEQLRLIMEERRARRRARREARSAPYTVTQWSAKSESLSTQNNPAGGRTHGDEPMDTAGSAATGEQHVCELNPPEPVVA
ncbi:midnolin homolog [Zootermopsis nevadensis]|uniref:midnolin homolog n=1 Tax=Zootermopsis nevadensis TaxID=136037 RepID=UPI000B8E3B2B|nr:midnolin homolog [Zootermopsis nevadensis]